MQSIFLVAIGTLPFFYFHVWQEIDGSGPLLSIDMGADSTVQINANPQSPIPNDVKFPEIPELIKQLGSPDFSTREKAYRRIVQMPEAYVHLLPALYDKDSERRARAERAVDELFPKTSQRWFRNLLDDIEKTKQPIPLDLLVEIIVRNSSRMQEQDWDRVFNAIAVIQENALQGVKRKPMVRNPRDRIPFKDDGSTTIGLRLSGNSLALDQLYLGFAATKNELRLGHCHGGIVLTNGTAAGRIVGRSFLFANGADMCEMITDSLVFIDGDLRCVPVRDSVVVLSGRLKEKEFVRESVIIENSKEIPLFSFRSIGLEVSPKDKMIRVDRIVPGSVCERAGFVPGDVILHDGTLRELERAVCSAIGRHLFLMLQVRRGADLKEVTISFVLRPANVIAP